MPECAKYRVDRLPDFGLVLGCCEAFVENIPQVGEHHIVPERPPARFARQAFIPAPFRIVDSRMVVRHRQFGLFAEARLSCDLIKRRRAHGRETIGIQAVGNGHRLTLTVEGEIIMAARILSATREKIKPLNRQLQPSFLAVW